MLERATLCLLAIVALAACAPARGQDETAKPAGTAPYEQTGLLYEGYASIPWHGVFSPDGRFVAVVEGYSPANFVLILDARPLDHLAQTNRSLARFETESQPGSYRPAFSADGERLVLIEGEALRVRTRENEWKPGLRVPLGFSPSISMNPRSITLSPDEKEAVFVHADRAYRVALEEPSVSKVDVTDAHAVRYLAKRLAVSRWSDDVAETVFPAAGLTAAVPLPFAVLAAAEGGKTWLVARNPHGTPNSALHLVDGASHENLAEVVIRGRRGLTAAVFSPDGAHLVTIEDLRTAVVRDARNGRVLQRIVEYEGDRLIGVAFSPDGRTLVTAGRRGRYLQKSVLRWRRR